MRSRTGIVVFSVAALAWSTHALAERGFTAEFVNGQTRPRSIALLPVEANVVRARIVETEGLVDESVAYGALYNAQIAALMTAKGYEVQIVDPEQINADPQLQEYVVDAKRAFDQMMSNFRPKRVESRIYNAGDSVRLLADRLGVDAVAFSSLSMTITPAGKAIVSALVGGSTAGTNASLALVDGGSGDLEATFFGINFVAPGEKTDEEMHAQVAQVAERTMNRLPGADPSARIEIAAGDEEVLSEIESLLEN